MTRADRQPSPQIHFEPASHTTGDIANKLVAQILETHDAETNEWNQAATDRMASYAPDFIVLDSVSCIRFEEDDLPLKLKKVLWTMIPDSPSLINGTDSIYVIGGDVIYGSADLNANLLYPSLIAGRNFARFGVGAYLGSKLGRGADHALYEYHRKVATYEPYTGTYHPEAAERITRRHYLKTMGALAGGVFVAKSNSFAANTPDGPIHDAARAITDTTKPLDGFRYFEAGKLVDRRTAIVIQKAYDFAQYMSDRDTLTGAVLMGTEHIPYSDLYMHDRKERLLRIGELSDFVIQAAKDKVPNTDKKDAWVPTVDEVKTMVRNYLVIRVEEPDKKALERDFDKEIDRIITLVEEVTSPVITDFLDRGGHE